MSGLVNDEDIRRILKDFSDAAEKKVDSDPSFKIALATCLTIEEVCEIVGLIDTMETNAQAFMQADGYEPELVKEAVFSDRVKLTDIFVGAFIRAVGEDVVSQFIDEADHTVVVSVVFHSLGASNLASITSPN